VDFGAPSLLAQACISSSKFGNTSLRELGSIPSLVCLLILRSGRMRRLRNWCAYRSRALPRSITPSVAAGQWEDALTPAQVNRIVRDHGEQMQRFGYLPLDCVPIRAAN